MFWILTWASMTTPLSHPRVEVTARKANGGEADAHRLAEKKAHVGVKARRHVALDLDLDSRGASIELLRPKNGPREAHEEASSH